LTEPQNCKAGEHFQSGILHKAADRGRFTAISKTARLGSGQTGVCLAYFFRAIESGAAIAKPPKHLFEGCM
jgi:hypothetical protein